MTTYHNKFSMVAWKLACNTANILPVLWLMDIPQQTQPAGL